MIWAFPRVWYTAKNTSGRSVWLSERTEVKDWSYSALPVAESAERLLVADRLTNGEFQAADGRKVRVFSAKRYEEKSDDIGLFVHTPDRCWTETGWKMEADMPDFAELSIHGLPMVFERRVFSNPLGRELVYFAGVVNGQPLPYRLDHNLSVGMRYAMKASKADSGTGVRASDRRFWQRFWDSVKSRSPLLGPKQFVRISTPLGTSTLKEADELLVGFLEKWLEVSDFHLELQAWKGTRASSEKKR